MGSFQEIERDGGCVYHSCFVLNGCEVFRGLYEGMHLYMWHKNHIEHVRCVTILIYRTM